MRGSIILGCYVTCAFADWTQSSSTLVYLPGKECVPTAGSHCDSVKDYLNLVQCGLDLLDPECSVQWLKVFDGDAQACNASSMVIDISNLVDDALYNDKNLDTSLKEKAASLQQVEVTTTTTDLKDGDLLLTVATIDAGVTDLCATITTSFSSAMSFTVKDKTYTIDLLDTLPLSVKMNRRIFLTSISDATFTPDPKVKGHVTVAERAYAKEYAPNAAIHLIGGSLVTLVYLYLFV